MVFYAYFWLRPLEFSLAILQTILSSTVLGYAHLWYVAGLLGAALALLLLKKLKPSLLTVVMSIVVTFLAGVAVPHVQSSARHTA